MEAKVFGFVDYAHAAAAQLLDDPVMGNCLSDHGNSGWAVGRARL
jgi:hypothetical protein